jgi:hypothetical protein
MSERSEAFREWTVCAWCWRELPTEPIRRPYCSQRCAGHDATVTLHAGTDDQIVDIHEEQLTID